MNNQLITIYEGDKVLKDSNKRVRSISRIKLQKYKRCYATL